MFVLPSLPYSYGALEPYISGQIMELHHARHQQAYVDGLNSALQKEASLIHVPLETLLRTLPSVPESVRMTVRNHGGGVWNHTFFWECMTPSEVDKKRLGHPFFDAINAQFGSFEFFVDQFLVASRTLFGSGWVWLCIEDSGKLGIISTSNQDCPLSQGLTPLLGLDVWEHAYYLQYYNKRVDYSAAWWNTISWAKVCERYELVTRYS